MKKIKIKKIFRYLISILIFLIYVFLGIWPGITGDGKDIWDEMFNWRNKDSK